MAALPYFPFFAQDWLSDPDVTTMPLDVQGAYIRLLANMWVAGHGRCDLLDDDEGLARLLGIGVREWKKMRTRLTPVFRVEDGRISNDKLTELFAKAEQLSQTNAENGSKGGRPRKADGNPPESDRKPIGFVSQTERQTETKPILNLKSGDPEEESVPSGLNGPSPRRQGNSGPVGRIVDRWRECPNVPHDTSDGKFFAGIWRTYKGMDLQTILDAIGELDVLTATRQLDGDPRKYLAAMLERKRDEQRKREREEQEQRDADARRQAKYLEGLERNGESIQDLDELAKDPEQRRAIVRKMREERAKLAQGGVEDAGAPIPF